MQKKIWMYVAAVLLLFSSTGTAVASRLSDLEREISRLKSDSETKAKTVEDMGDAPFIQQRKLNAALAADAAREKYHAKQAELDEARRIEAAQAS